MREREQGLRVPEDQRTPGSGFSPGGSKEVLKFSGGELAQAANGMHLDWLGPTRVKCELWGLAGGKGAKRAVREKGAAAPLSPPAEQQNNGPPTFHPEPEPRVQGTNWVPNQKYCHVTEAINSDRLQ